MRCKWWALSLEQLTTSTVLSPKNSLNHRDQKTFARTGFCNLFKSISPNAQTPWTAKSNTNLPRKKWHLYARGVGNSAEKNRNLHGITANSRKDQIHQAMPTVTPMMRKNLSCQVSRSRIRGRSSLRSSSNKKSKIFSNSLMFRRCQSRSLSSLLTSRE